MDQRLLSPFKIGTYMVKWLVITACLGVLMGGTLPLFLNKLNCGDGFTRSTYLVIVSITLSVGHYLRFFINDTVGMLVIGNNLVIDQGNGGEEKSRPIDSFNAFGTITTHLLAVLSVEKEQQSKWVAL